MVYGMHMYLLYKQRVERRGGLICEGTEPTSICGMVLEDFVKVLGGFLCGVGGVGCVWVWRSGAGAAQVRACWLDGCLEILQGRDGVSPVLFFLA